MEVVGARVGQTRSPDPHAIAPPRDATATFRLLHDPVGDCPYRRNYTGRPAAQYGTYSLDQVRKNVNYASGRQDDRDSA